MFPLKKQTNLVSTRAEGRIKFNRFSHDEDLPLLSSTQQFVPKIEMKDRENTFQVCVEVPGMTEKDLNVTLKDHVLVIEGEKKNETKNEDKKKGFYHSEFSYGTFYRAIPLSDEANPDEVTANCKDGILVIDVAKRPEQARTGKRIEIGRDKSNKQTSETKH
jgi:HSP20 family protein